MKKIIVAIIFTLVLSCSLDPYGDGLGKNSTGENDYVGCKPAAVSGVWTVNKSSSGITMAWNKSKNAKFYNIYRDSKLIKSTTDTSFEDSKLRDEQTYKYKITSVNDCGENMQPVSHAECTRPTAPTGVSVKTKSKNVIEISYNHYSWSGFHYNIYRSNEESGKYSLIGTSSSSTFTDTITVEGNVFYKVTRFNDCGESDMSQAASCASLSKPNLSALSLSARTVLVSWKEIEGASGYELYRATNAAGPYTGITGITGTLITQNYLSLSTTYYYFVIAKNNCFQINSDTVSVKTLIDAPTEITAEAVSASNIKISWKRINEAIGYNIYRSLEIDGEYEMVASPIDTLFIDEALLANTRYFYKVSATDGGGRKGELSGNVSATTKNCADAPAKPDGLAAQASSPRSIKISWNETYGASSYEIYASASETGNYSRAAKIQNSLNYTDTLLKSSTIYYYKIIAINDCGKSDTSNVVFATTQDCPTPLAPQGVSAQALSASEIKILWEKVEGADYYKIYRATSETGTYSQIGDMTGDMTVTQFISKSLSPVTTYYYKIVANAGCGKESEMSNFAFATTQSCQHPYLAPTGVTANAISARVVKVSWDKPNESHYYDVYRATSEAGTYELVETKWSNDLSFTDRYLSSATTYYYKVKGRTSCGTSEFSNIASVTTPVCDLPLAPTGVTAIAQSFESIKISWNIVSGASAYNIYFSRTAEGEYTFIASISAQFLVTTFVDVGLSASRTYYYKVSAVNSCEEGDKSDYAYDTTKSP